LTGIEQADDRRLRGWLSVRYGHAGHKDTERKQGAGDPGENARDVL